jgi:aminoglycoside phosphotransferase (APT) family kinase protein
MRTPPADIDVDENLVRRMLSEQHPDLATLPLRLAANGWDNLLYRLGDDLVLRIPRRTIAAPLIAHEQRWLPLFAERVRVALPVPVLIGTPSALFPFPWSVCRWMDGELAADIPFPEHGGLAEDLAGFLRELQVPAPADAPANEFRGVPLSPRTAAVEERLAGGTIPRSEQLLAAWRVALAAPVWDGPPLWLHGDLHPANILVRGGRLTGVLDFGDLTAGDPASDLATAWLTFDREGRAEFIRALDYSDADWARARGWAIYLGTAFLGGSEPDSVINRIGLHALEQVLLPD